MPRNSLVNGKAAPDSFGTQFDETSYPILMADQFGLTDSALYQNHVKPAASFIISHGPAFGVERWEEQSGYSPSTIAAEIAGLAAAADIAHANGDTASANLWLGVADDWQRSVKGWTVTTNGTLAGHPYFIRLSKTGDPNAAISYNVGNGGPTLDQRSVMDAGFLELARLGELSAHDADIQQTLPVLGRDDREPDAERAGLAPLQRRRLRRRRYRRPPLGTERARNRPPLARAVRGARRAASFTSGDAAGAAGLLQRHGQLRLRRRPDPRAGLGSCPTSPRRRTGHRRRRPRSASATAARPVRRHRSPGRPPHTCGSPPTSPPAATSSCPPSPTAATSPTTRARRR